jgi:hypothetical protein
MKTQLNITLKDTALANKGYLEIRESCKLVEYDLKLAGKGKLWVEVYRDSEYEYRALFPDLDDWSAMPMTILTHKLHETQTNHS